MNVAELTTAVLEGAAVIVVSGGVLSTTQVNDAGVASVLPAASRARTSNVWLPSPRLLMSCGLVAAANVAPSRRDSNVEVSFALNVNVMVFDAVCAGEVVLTAVTGAVVSAGGGGGGGGGVLPPPPPPPHPISRDDTSAAIPADETVIFIFAAPSSTRETASGYQCLCRQPADRDRRI